MILVFHYRNDVAVWLYAQRLFKPSISRMRSEQILKHHTAGTVRSEEGDWRLEKYLKGCLRQEKCYQSSGRHSIADQKNVYRRSSPHFSWIIIAGLVWFEVSRQE
jgi:hypothetical protein